MVIFILVNMDSGQYCVLQTPGYQLRQPVGVGGKYALEPLALSVFEVFLLQKQYNFYILRSCQVPGQLTCHKCKVQQKLFVVKYKKLTLQYPTCWCKCTVLGLEVDIDL